MKKCKHCGDEVVPGIPEMGELDWVHKDLGHDHYAAIEEN